MSNQDKKDCAALQPMQVEDPPPPYSPYKPSSVPKPPQLPSEPPALTREPLPARRPQDFRSRNQRAMDYVRYSAWQDSKAYCCSTNCWSWSK